MLRLVGHKAVAVLDGGFGTWLSEKRPVQSGIESRTPARFPTPIDIHYNWIVSAEEVNLLRQNSDILLLDARAPERFKGEVEPIDTVAGHIPGAVNRFHGANISADGKMKSSEILRSEFKNILGSIPPSKVVVYCGSGVTSCHHLLAMENAGLKGARIYIGSWSEWIRNPDHPIAKS
jgi:thiosulfate/3-mercaptopyruvate sulfurtransferase